MRSRRSARSTRLVVYGRGARAYSVLQQLREPPVQRRGDRHFEDVAAARPGGAVVGEEIRRQRRVDELGASLVRFVEERRHARLDQIPEPFEARDVIGREPEPPGPVRHGPRPGRGGDRARERLELLLELDARQRRGVRMPAHVGLGARRRFPGVVMRADFAIAAREQPAKHVGRPGIARDRIRDDVGRPHAVPGKQRVQPRQRVDVLERLPRARGGVPLVVAFGVDADEEPHRSWSESPSVTCQRSTFS